MCRCTAELRHRYPKIGLLLDKDQLQCCRSEGEEPIGLTLDIYQLATHKLMTAINGQAKKIINKISK